MSVLDWTYVKAKIESVLHSRIFVGRAVDTADLPAYTVNEGVAPSIDKDSGAMLVKSIAGGGTITEYTEDAPAATNPTGFAVNLIRKDTPSATVSADGDNIAQRGTDFGSAYVTLLDSAGAPVSVVGGTGYVEDAASAGGETGNVALGVRRDADTSPVSASGDFHTMIYDALGNLKVNVKSQPALDAATDDMTIYGQFDDASTAVPSEDGLAAMRITEQRALHTNLRTAAGVETGVAAAPLQVSLANHAANATAVKVDGSAVTQPVSGTVTANLAAGTNTNEVVGDAAHDAVVSGNPVLIGAEARDGNGTPVASGDVTRLNTDRFGRIQNRKPKLTPASSNGTPVTTATTTTVVAAPSAGNHLVVHRIHAANASATPTWIYWKAGVGGTKLFAAYLPTGGIASLALNGSWELATATLLALETSAAASVEWTVETETVAD